MSRPEGSTRLDDPVTVQDEDLLSEQDRRRIDQVRRNARIRHSYPDLRDEHGRDEALQILSERYSVSPSTARLIVYEQL